MNKRTALAALLAGAAGPAVAQFGGRRRGGGEPRVNLLETTAHELHEDLKLTPLQEPLWEAYLEKVRLLGNDIARERVQQPSGRTVARQIDRIVETARNRLAALEDIAQAAKDLYAQLSPDQQPWPIRGLPTS